jgi:dynein heavy chain 1
LFRNGQRLLEKQRFQFPPSWLYIDNIEGEWGAFSDIMKRKDTAIQQQVANLQMKIVQEDRAVEGRTTDLLTDWEKAKPVAVSSRCISQSQCLPRPTRHYMNRSLLNVEGKLSQIRLRD